MTDRRKFLISSLGATLASTVPATAKIDPVIGSDNTAEPMDQTVSFGKPYTRRRASVQAQSGIESAPQASFTEEDGKRPPLSFLPSDATPLRERFGLPEEK